jgi:hypothetical protein
MGSFEKQVKAFGRGGRGVTKSTTRVVIVEHLNVGYLLWM